MNKNSDPMPAKSTPRTPLPPEHQMALFTHLSALAGIVIPFGNIIGPLVMWLIGKDTLPFVDDQGKEALNFNITVTLASIVCFILMFVIIGYFLGAILFVAWFIFVIIAAVKANEGIAYRYPLTLRLIK